MATVTASDLLSDAKRVVIKIGSALLVDADNSAVRVAWLASLTMSPLQFVNFGLIPLRFRVLVTNFQDVIWNASVSYMAHRSRSIKKDETTKLD